MKKLLTVVLTALLSSASLSAAQTAVNAVVTAPGAQPMVMPLNVQLLPYGTVTIANGTYFIPNYEGTGISIYIQSPQTIRVATLEETVRYQAEWMRITQAISSGRSTTPAAAPQAASVPVMPQATPQAQTFPTSPAAAISVPGTAVPTLASAMPVASAPAMNWTAPSTAAVSSTPAPTLANFPTAAAPLQQPAAPAPTTFPSANNLFQQAAFPTAPSAFPAAATAFTPTTTAPQVASAPATAVPSVAPQVQQAQYTPTTTLVPEYLRVNFRGRGTNVTYSLSNTSSSQAMQIDPASLRAYQNGQPVEAQLAQRDSSGGTNGVLMPRAMLVGTISVLTRSAAPITITWQAKDTQGRVYPIAYAWMPE
ncbi:MULTISPECIES: hypothetical protein [unclassified Deinococcus]|uniref:hypothetical protein n=1 Tax=unclassified Deinococcus TaxID=2623546 RepID=UPI0009D21511|nr:MULTISPECIES: hypothetical protein [unclassified Deinococcus]MBX8465600.1 hypothetical protein [Deinococcus sp. RIT780]NTX99147.1 hypothetical protein [Deinococcus sp. JMULE3]OOV12120.1 hypothetical protein BXU09_17540 [Deinococcus sp. LM3]